MSARDIWKMGAALLAGGIATLSPVGARYASPGRAYAAKSSARQEPPLIIPRPKRVSVPASESPFPITDRTRIVVPDHASTGILRAAAALRREIRQRFGVSLSQISASEAKTPVGAILIGGPGSDGNPLLAALQRSEAVPPTPDKPEGYAVGVAAPTVAIAGHDDRGALWGAETVIQLLGRAADGSPVILPARVEDWPTLSLRAVHLFTGTRALPFQEKLIDRIFSRYKMNALFLQAERARWDNDPKAAPAWGGTKADLTQEIAYARERGITVYPLMESYGHMEWLLQNGHADLAEDPKTPYALNYSDPRAVAYVEGFNTEAADLFGAPGFHIGFDEVAMRGRFPYRSLPKSGASLFVAAARHWHDVLARRHQQMWMWADETLYAGDVRPCYGSAPSARAAAAIRAGLPKDTVLVDWQYESRASYPSLKRLRDAGFKNLVGATWWYPEGIQSFSRAAAAAHALGMIQTTWCGYESSEDVLSTEERRQFTAMILAADYYWNGGEGPAPNRLPYDPAKIFTQQWEAAP